MKSLRLLCILPALLLAVAPASAEPKKNRPDTKIEEAMDEMGQAFKPLRKQVADAAQNTSSLALIAKIQAGLAESAKHVPLRAKTIAEKDRETWLAKYRKGLQDFSALLGKAEAALKAGDNAAAAKLVEQAGEAIKASHKEFKQPDEKKPKKG